MPPKHTPRSRSVLGAKIQQLRKSNGWSQSDLGSLIGRHQSRVAKWELGQGKPEPHDILRIARAFKIPLEFLCDDTQDEPVQESSGFAASMESDEDMMFLMSLVKRFGARSVIDRFFGQVQAATAEENEPPAPAKLVGVHRRPLRPSE